MNGLRFLALLFFLWLITSRGGIYEILTDEQRELLSSYVTLRQQELRTVTDCSLNTPLAALNLTNVRPARHPGKVAPILPEAIEPLMLAFWAQGQNTTSYFTNLSSIVHGVYTDQSRGLDKVPMPLPGPFANISTPNSTFALVPKGKVTVDLREANNTQGRTREVFAALSIGTNDIIHMHGAYLDKGHLIMSTRSAKYSGDLAVPFLVPESDPSRPETVNATRHIISASVNESVTAIASDLDFSQVDLALERASACEFVFYGHLHSAHLSTKDLDDIERELRHPVGRPLPKIPPVKLQGLLYSPDCGLCVTLDSSGERIELYQQRVQRVLTGVVGILLAIAYLMAKQMSESSTPSSAARISFWTIALTALVDGMVCMMAMAGTFELEYLLQLMAVVMVAFGFTTMFELKYMVLIYFSQLNEDYVPVTNGHGDENVVAQQRAQAVSDMSESQVASMIYGRFYFTLLICSLVTISSFAWSDDARRLFEAVFLAIAYSYWVPQIYRNARRGFQRPLLPVYIVGVSILRLAPFIYFCFYRHNVGYHHHAPVLGWSIIGWQALQVLILILQRVFGSRILFPGCNVHVYDYHPLVTSDLEQSLHTEDVPSLAGSGTGARNAEVGDDRPEDGNGDFKQVDCAICMDPVKLVMATGRSSIASPRSLLARQKYMITPCRHVFHSQCLDEWMRSKLQCPVCRNPLPPT